MPVRETSYCYIEMNTLSGREVFLYTFLVHVTFLWIITARQAEQRDMLAESAKAAGLAHTS
jgi:hypothetical protein